MQKIIIIILVIVAFIGGGALSAATLKWDKPPGDVSGFKIYYGEDTTNLNLLAEVDSTTFSYSLNSLSLSTLKTYFFVVTAFNSSGESDHSNTVTIGDVTPPYVPTGLKAE
jgi:hypothetical protein